MNCRGYGVVFVLTMSVLLAASCRRAPMELDRALIRVDDGDTIHYGDETFRIVGIDTPEIKHEEHGFFQDQPGGRRAKAQTAAIIGAARLIEYLPCGDDRYGRTLVHLFVDGELLAVKLIRARLAYETVTYYGHNGYPELAELILQAVDESPRPDFEPPWKWKRKQRRK